MTYLSTIIIVTCDDVVALVVLDQGESGTEDGLGEDRHDGEHMGQRLHSLNTGL